MNLFAGIGRITDSQLNGKVLKFNLAVQQEKPCYLPCLIFNPSDDTLKRLFLLQETEQRVWLQGKVSSYEFEYQGRTIRKIEIVSYPGNIKTV